MRPDRVSSAAVCGSCTRVHLLERLPFGFKIGTLVVVGGVQADMPEPTADHGHVDTRGDHRHSHRVPEGVWRHVLSFQRGHTLRRYSNVVLEPESRTSSTERLTISVQEDLLVFGPRLPFKQRCQKVRCLWPQWTDSLLAPFTKQRDLCGRPELDGSRAEIQCFLDLRTGIV